MPVHSGHEGHGQAEKRSSRSSTAGDDLDSEAEKAFGQYAVPMTLERGPEACYHGGAGLRRYGTLREVLTRTTSRPGLVEGGGVPEKKARVDLGDGHGEQEVVMIDWAPNDPDNPFCWSQRRKYLLVCTAVLTTALTAMNCTSVSLLAAAGAPDHFGVTREQFLLSLTVLLLGISFTPLVLAPLSESYGRNGIYHITSVISALLFLPQTFSTSYPALLAVRTFQGMSSSVGNSMVGGTVADLFRAEDRGVAMSIFSLVIFAGQSLGGVVFGWVAMDLGIPWVYGLQAILGAFSCILNAFFLRETRGDVLLSRRAKRLTKETGRLHLCAADLQRQDMRTLITVSLIRPLHFLVTEPIVSALSAWIGFAWATVFLGGTSVLLVFQQYGWNYGQLGSIQIVVLIGGILGTISNYHQEHLYHRAARRSPTGRAAPEARLYWAAYGGLLFPLSMFVFAWTGRSDVPWAIPAVVLCVANWGIYAMYLGVFNYLADAYETYSSSAQAAQSFTRNILSAFFPLFARQMYTNLGYPQASSLVASIALVLAAAPLLLLRYGKVLRARSKVASALESDATVAVDSSMTDR